MDAKVRGGIAVGMLVGLVSVAAAVALMAAVPAPAPAEPEETAVSEVISAIANELQAASEANNATADGADENHSTADDSGSDSRPESGATEAQDNGAGAENAAVDETDGEPPSAPSAADSPSSSKAPVRHWVVDYERVWVPNPVEVVVEPERVETIYETRDVLVCNVPGCGYSTESSGDMASHWGQHAMKGVDEGYSSVPRKVAVGTRTVPAVTRTEDHGEYRTVESGGHWE